MSFFKICLLATVIAVIFNALVIGGLHLAGLEVSGILSGLISVLGGVIGATAVIKYVD